MNEQLLGPTWRAPCHHDVGPHDWQSDPNDWRTQLCHAHDWHLPPIVGPVWDTPCDGTHQLPDTPCYWRYVDVDESPLTRACASR